MSAISDAPLTSCSLAEIRLENAPCGHGQEMDMDFVVMGNRLDLIHQVFALM